ncbi:MAG: DUF362 domain-containing protein [Syntrophaceae bacterium]|nr:DUF362 domain-containing protein [Syntrophaceae bacterium]
MSHDESRRKFLKNSLVVSAAMAGASFGLIDPLEAGAEDYPDMSICNGKDAALITRQAVEALGGIKRFVRPGAKVVIKPNMSFARSPETAANTNPLVVREVARMCAEAGASRISIVDNVLNNPADCMKLSKIPEYCKDVPNTHTNYIKNERLFREVSVERGTQFKKMRALSDALDADTLIAVPVGKSHGSAGVSMSMKGMMGLIYDRTSFHNRYDLHESIVDMVTVLKPHLVVIDGTRILSTGGPGGPGEVIPLDLVIASADMVAADAQMVALGKWYGKKLEPKQIKHIRMAAERGLGRIDLDKLNIKKISV